MFLLIDQGNSRCKYLLTEALGDIKAVDSGSWENQDFDTASWKGLLAPFQAKGIGRVLVSSVAGQARKEWFGALCHEVLGIWPEFAESGESYVSTSSVTLSNCYDTPQALGVDRWLAMIAVSERVTREFIVIDAGTAITTDWVNHKGQHQGGHIIPGGRMLQQSLLGQTGGIAWSAKHDSTAKGELLGENTSAAVALGAETMIKGYCYQVMKDVVNESSGKQLSVLVTGGDGPFVTECLQRVVEDMPLACRVEYQPNLVIEGLSHWFSLNN
ncbi:type III pantothenate kinase [Kangiella marina]|uniref:Type III pantothenate kinase n=1 Tax=Kangiella marina TaxID=1079178 RepID=A0ABP8IL34_9GAMM